MLLDFVPSEALVRRVLENLVANGITVPKIQHSDIVELQKEWGAQLGSIIGSFAQMARYGGVDDLISNTEGVTTLWVIKDGQLPKAMSDRFVFIPPGEVGDEIIKDFTQEFITWLCEHCPKEADLAPGGPISKLELLDQNLLVYVRPPTYKHIPGFTKARVLE